MQGTEYALPGLLFEESMFQALPGEAGIPHPGVEKLIGRVHDTTAVS